MLIRCRFPLKIHFSGLCFFITTFLVFMHPDINSQDVQREREGNMSEVPVLIHALSTEPLLPFFSSFVALYEYRPVKRNGFLLGFWYGKSTSTYPKDLEYPGYVQNYSAILAYRFYFWKNLHAEYQLYPGLSVFYDEVADRRYNSFSLFNEFRIGYRFDLQIGKIPFLLCLQLPVGFTLYESNEPESFRSVRKQDPVFYIFIPNIYLGIRF